MISWLYIAVMILFLLGGIIYLMTQVQLALIISVVNFFLLVIVFLRVRQLLKWHEKIFSTPRESKINEETIKTLIRIEEEKK